MAHTSTTSTLPSMTALPTALTAERDAGAAWRVLAEQAHLAAVMGPSLTRNLRPGDGWSA